jgi:hypothetical protein
MKPNAPTWSRVILVLVSTILVAVLGTKLNDTQWGGMALASQEDHLIEVAPVQFMHTLETLRQMGWKEPELDFMARQMGMHGTQSRSKSIMEKGVKDWGKDASNLGKRVWNWLF